MVRGRWTQSVWLRIQEPRFLTMVQTVIYALCAVAGVVTIMSPPNHVSDYFGTAFTVVWGSFAIAGGLAGVISCPTGKWLIEKPAIMLCATALALYVGVIFTIHVLSDGSRIAQILFVSIALLHFVGRYARIRPYSYEPGK